MREHILISFIALVGFSGLLTIHHEVSDSQSESRLVSSAFYEMPASHPVSTTANWQPSMVIEPHSNYRGICISIPSFNHTDQFLIDLGNGKRIPVGESELFIDSFTPGNYLVKLFRNQQLLEASHIRIPEL